MRAWGGALLAALSVGLLAACATQDAGQAQQQAPGQSGDGSVAAAEQGEQLSKADAAGLEQKLQNSPADLTSREELVGYYFIAQAIDIAPSGSTSDSSAPTIARDHHLLWLIDNDPALELLGDSPLGVVAPKPDAAGYTAATQAWLHQAGAQAVPAVKGNAGIFFAQTFDPRAFDLLAAAEAGDAHNPSWPAALGDLYALRAKNAPLGSAAGKDAAAEAVDQMEKAWNAGGSQNNDPVLSEVAKLAVVAGEDDKAVQYATVLLETFKPGSGQSNLVIGGPIHDGNMVLGQVALRKGDKTGAEQYLLKAGATPGSPQLDQFGPNFSLARDLLLAGSRDVVLKYCDEVAKFWNNGKLASWRAAISAGSIPDFGDNLWN